MTPGAAEPRVVAVGEPCPPPMGRRIVIVAGDLPYLLRFRRRLLSTLSAAGHEVVVATPESDPPLDVLAQLGVTHSRIGLQRTGMNPLRDLRDVVDLAAWMRARPPDVVFAYGAKPIMVGLAAAALRGVPRRYAMLAGLGFGFVEDGRTSAKRAVARTIQMLAYAALFRGCRRVVFHNRDDRDELVRRRLVARDRTTVVAGSGVDLEEFAASPVPTSPVRFTFVGRLLRSKGVDELVRAAGAVRAAVPDAEVHLVGSFDANPDQFDAEALEAAVARGDVVLHGQVADVRPQLRACSVFVLPSYREGLPRSALEALAMGRTAIVTDVPGCREVVRAGLHGTLVPPRDADALAAAMVAYAHDPERCVREGVAARLTAERDFDVGAVTRAMLVALELSEDAIATT